MTSTTGFHVCRFLLGLMEAGFFPGIILYLTYWYPPAKRAHTTAMFLTAIPVSGLVGGPLSGWILENFSGASGMSGWQWLFLLEGLPSIVLGVVTLFYLDDGILGAKWLTQDEKKLLAHHIEMEKQEKTRHSLKDCFINASSTLLGPTRRSFSAAPSDERPLSGGNSVRHWSLIWKAGCASNVSSSRAAMTSPRR